MLKQPSFSHFFSILLRGISLGGISVLAFLVFSYRMGEIPYGYHVDEVGMAYDAFCLSNWGVDRYCIRFPVYLINFGGGQSSLYAYLTALVYRVTDHVDLYNTRLPSTLSGIVIVWCAMLAIGKRFGEKAGWLAGFFCISLPYFIMRSRFALDCNLMLPFLALGITLLFLSAEHECIYGFFATGIIFGLSLYTYALNYIVLPLILVVLLFYLFHLGKLRFCFVVALGIPLGLLAAPLLAFIFINHFQLPSITTPFFTIPQMPYFRSSNFSPNDLSGFWILLKTIFAFDWAQYSSFPDYGVMYYISIPFTLLGLALVTVRSFLAFRNKAFTFDTFAAVLFWAVFFMAQFLDNNICCNRLNAIYFSTFYMLFCGLQFCCHHVAVLLSKHQITAAFPLLQSILPVVFCTVYAFCFFRFASFYYIRYPEISKEYPVGMMEVLPVDIMEVKGAELLTRGKVYLDMRYPYYLMATFPSPYDYQLSTENSGSGDSGNPAFQSLSFGVDLDNLDPAASYVIWNNNSFLWGPIQETNQYYREDFGDFILFSPLDAS